MKCSLVPQPWQNRGKESSLTLTCKLTFLVGSKITMNSFLRGLWDPDYVVFTTNMNAYLLGQLAPSQKNAGKQVYKASHSWAHGDIDWVTSLDNALNSHPHTWECAYAKKRWLVGVKKRISLAITWCLCVHMCLHIVGRRGRNVLRAHVAAWWCDQLAQGNGIIVVACRATWLRNCNRPSVPLPLSMCLVAADVGCQLPIA